MTQVRPQLNFKGISPTMHIIRNTPGGYRVTLLEQHHLCPLVEGWHSSSSHPVSLCLGKKTPLLARYVHSNLLFSLAALLSFSPSQELANHKHLSDSWKCITYTSMSPQTPIVWTELERLLNFSVLSPTTNWHHGGILQSLQWFILIIYSAPLWDEPYVT